MMMTPNNTSYESHLIKQILAGQREKYAELVDSFQNKIIHLCLSFLRNPVDAEDAAQEVFIKAYKALGKYSGDAQFSTWLYRIAVNHCHDILRKRAREKSDSLDQLTEQKGDEIHALFAEKSPLNRSDEDKDLVKRLLFAINPAAARILILRESQGFSYQEIAQILDCSLDAVKARLKRAREEIQEKTRHFLRHQNVEI